MFWKDANIKVANSQLDLGTLLRLSLRETKGARNPNLQVVITHALQVCSQHSFGPPLRMNGMDRTQFDHACLDPLSFVIWSRVFWLSLTWNLRTVMEQKRFDLWSLSPALRNLWLILVYKLILLFSGSQSTSGDPPWNLFLNQLISLFRSLYYANEKEPL